MRLILTGLNHRTAPLELRERYAVEDPAPHLEKLVAGPEVDEAVLLSTCNRVELLARVPSLEPARHRIRSFFLRDLGGERDGALDLEKALYEHSGATAVRHLFRVASAIDSMVVGEPQILGQVKAAHRAAVECGASGVILNRLLTRAFAAAKRVRRETGVAQRPVSVARVAVELADQIFERLAEKRALLVGAGDMVELALESLRGAGLREVRVANRTPANAERLAGRFGGTAHGLDEIPSLLGECDVVLSCVGGSEPLIGPEMVSSALRGRRHRAIFAIDLGVPRNIHPDVNALDGVYLYDVDDLEGIAAANAEARRREVERAEEIVAEEQQRFEGWLAALEAVPTIRHLRARGEAVRERELERFVRRLDLSPRQREGVEALTRAIVNKILHPPVSRLRAEAEREEGLAYLEAARVLFALDDPKAPGAEADAELRGEPEEPDEPEGGRGGDGGRE